MGKLALIAVILATGGGVAAEAADLAPGFANAENCPRARVCHVDGCHWVRTCRPPLRPSSCPDRYSCSPLYGAYGPWGGSAYWSRYTD